MQSKQYLLHPDLGRQTRCNLHFSKKLSPSKAFGHGGHLLFSSSPVSWFFIATLFGERETEQTERACVSKTKRERELPRELPVCVREYGPYGSICREEERERGSCLWREEGVAICTSNAVALAKSKV